MKNELLDAPSASWSSLDFRDPWFADTTDQYGKRNRGAAARFWSRPSPFSPDATTLYDGEAYKGVFLNQGNPTNLQPPYYTIRTRDDLSVGGSTARFLYWSASGASLVQEQGVLDTLRKAVIFHSPTATVKAVYKGRLLSSVAEASSQSGSQRRFARDVDIASAYYLVYESAGKIWLTYSTNGGASWQPERFIDDGARPSLAPRDGGVAVAYIVSDGADAEVRVRVFSLNIFNGTLSQTDNLYNNLWDCAPSASPSISWLGNKLVNIPTGTVVIPRYGVVYEASTSSGATELRLLSLENIAEGVAPTTLNGSSLAIANLQMYPAIDAAIPSNNYSPQTVQARLAYRQRSGSDGWLRYQPLTFDFSSPYGANLTQGAAQTLNWVGSGRAEPAGYFPTKPSIEVKNNIAYIAFEVEGKNDMRYTTVNSSHQQGAVTIFSQAGETLRSPSLHLQPNSVAPAIYFNMNGAVYEARWTAQSNWNIQKVASDGEHANIALRSGNRRFVYTANASAPFRLAFADGTTEGDAGSGGSQQSVVSGGGKGNAPSLAFNSGGGSAPVVEVATMERTTGVLSNSTETASLALTLADVGLNGDSRAGLTYHDLGANLLPDTLALSPSNVFSLLKSRRFTLADSINQVSATVKVQSEHLYDLTQNNPVQLAVELINASTGASIALSQTALITASDTAKDFHFAMTLPTAQSGTEAELRVKVLGFASQASHKASALNEIELVRATGGTAIANRAGNQARQSQSVGSVPTRFAMRQNYPNPFNPVTVFATNYRRRALSNFKSLMCWDEWWRRWLMNGATRAFTKRRSTRAVFPAALIFIDCKREVLWRRRR
ncbi:MAG: hypothetical protein NZM06_06180 [Chloroherpetonaceae bacterium]|nr:hypothetical protein [Chloroherpetonaceae bacterium]MDW8437501.1 hypothetical protein [Chloroherpetonaceae bacterium]